MISVYLLLDCPDFSISHHRDCNIVRFNSSIFETYTNLINETDV